MNFIADQGYTKSAHWGSYLFNFSFLTKHFKFVWLLNSTFQVDIYSWNFNFKSRNVSWFIYILSCKNKMRFCQYKALRYPTIAILLARSGTKSWLNKIEFYFQLISNELEWLFENASEDWSLSCIKTSTEYLPRSRCRNSTITKNTRNWPHSTDKNWPIQHIISSIAPLHIAKVTKFL